jgi:hypothetical protein
MSFIKKNANWIILAILILIGAYLRIYRHDDFIHFELDQARDAMIISKAYNEVAGELPLLGPRAAGTMLRLGPYFYYQEYISAKIFGNTPAAMNAIGMYLSIATILLIYIFLRYYFSKTISLSGTAVFSVSLFTVTYSRFSWNPNNLPFFITALLICLLAYIRSKKFKFIYVHLGVICMTITMQLHFLAFIAVPIIIVLFLIIDRVVTGKTDIYKVQRKHYVLAIILMFLLNSPIIINEYLTGGDNTKEFFKAVTEKKEKGDKHNFSENIVRSIQEYSKGAYIILTGNQQIEVFGINLFQKEKIISVECDKECRKRLPFTFVSYIFFLGGISILFKEIYFQRKEPEKVKFLILNFLLISVPFFAFLSAAYKFPPRFYLITLPVFFVLLCLWLTEIAKLSKKIKEKFEYAVVVFLVGGLVILNIYYNYERFVEQAVAHTNNPIYFKKDLILKEDIRFTLIQQNLIIDWMIDNAYYYTIFVWAPPKYYRPFLYHLNYQRDKDGIKLKDEISCVEAEYFAVTMKDSLDNFLEERKEIYSVSDRKNFGTLTVHKLDIVNPDSVLKVECEPNEEEKPKSYARRYTWKEVFNKELR